MTLEGSITHWIQRIPEGDPEAVQQLWERYFQRLVRLARARLKDFPRAAVDEEDLALSALESFCRGAELGRFPQLEDRDNLWSLLVTITARKVLNLKRDAQREKRGGSRDETGTAEEWMELENVLGREPSPEFAAEAAEECERLLKLLGKPELRAVALWKMEGFTNQEIATKLNRAPDTVTRKLKRIRNIWKKQEQT